MKCRALVPADGYYEWLKNGIERINDGDVEGYKSVCGLMTLIGHYAPHKEDL